MRRSLITTAFILACLLIIAGCQTPHRLAVNQFGQVEFDSLAINYSTRTSLSPDRLQSSDSIQQTGGLEEFVSSPPVPVELSIESPHPHKGYEFALMKVSGTSNDGRQFQRELAVSASQVDLLLYDMAHRGFFQPGNESAARSVVDVQIDKGRTQRNWDATPRLDDFVERVLAEGTLVLEP